MHSIHYEILPVIQILPYNFQHYSPSVPWLTYELSPLFYTWTSWTCCLLCWLRIWSWQVDSRLSRKSRRMDSERDRAHNKNKCVLSALSDHTQSRLVCALTHAPGPCPKVKNPLPNSHRTWVNLILCFQMSVFSCSCPLPQWHVLNCELNLGRNRNKILSEGVVGLSVSQNWLMKNSLEISGSPLGVSYSFACNATLHFTTLNSVQSMFKNKPFYSRWPNSAPKLSFAMICPWKIILCEPLLEQFWGKWPNSSCLDPSQCFIFVRL